MMSRFFGPGLDRAAVDEDRRPIEPRHRHDAARHVLVAAADRDEAVEAFGRRDGLDRVRDDLARHERVAHARRAVGDAVRDGDRVEQHALARRRRRRPRRRARASPSMCMLHGVTMFQVEAMPTCGFAKSSSLKPTARSMARLGACVSPSTTTRECRRGSTPGGSWSL